MGRDPHLRANNDVLLGRHWLRIRDRKVGYTRPTTDLMTRVATRKQQLHLYYSFARLEIDREREEKSF
jgi:hypothetical protein